MEPENRGEVVPFENKLTRESKKTLNALISILQAIKDNRLNYVIMCASVKRPDMQHMVLPTEVIMTYHAFDTLKEEELQTMIEFLQDGSDNLIKLYYATRSS